MKLRVKRIIFVAIISVFGVITLFSPMRFQTSLSSLLNLENVDGWPVQTITENFSSVINIVIQSKDRLTGDAAAFKIRDMLNSQEFSEFEIMSNNFSARDFVSDFGKYHNVMIGKNDRNLLADEKFSDIANNARLKMETSMSPNVLPLSQDPFLLFTNYLFEMAKNGTNWVPQNGVLWQYVAPYNYYMLTVKLNISDNEELVKSVKKLKTGIGKPDDVQIYMGGAPVHTAEMYNRSKIELGIISILAIVAVIVLNYILFRRARTILPIMVSLAVGYLAGTIALFLCFGAPHILVFVFGTSLIGLGIDYTFHIINIGNKRDTKLVQQNILYSLLTTIICFAPLMFSSILMLRQIAVFTIVGLVAIYAFIKLFVSCRADGPKQKFVRPLNKKIGIWVTVGLVLGTVLACRFARVENNISAIYKPTADLAISEQKIAVLNQSDKSAMMVVRGDNIQSVLETEEEIRNSGVDFFGVSSFVPSARRQIENQEMVKKLYAAQAKNIRNIMGLKSLPRFVEGDLVNIENLGKRVKNFLFEKDGFVYSVGSVSADALVENPNARIIAPAKQIQSQMTKYSHEVYRLLWLCGIILVIGLVVLYRGRAFRYLLPPLLGVGGTIAILTAFGMSITFFHLLGLFIVIGLGLDYAIFHINAGRGGEMWPVFYSFLTSFIGFGLLAFTSFSIISALGMTLAIGIAVSYVVSLYLFRN